MIVVIHQPNYLPWLGYFYKIYAADIFVFHDRVALSRTSYTRRSRIRDAKSSDGNTWLSIPLRRHPTGTLISEILIDHSTTWIAKHLRKIANTYAAAPFYDRYFPWLKEVLNSAYTKDSLSEANMACVRAVAEKLGLSATFRQSSRMELTHTESALNFEIVQQLGGSHYLSGTGGRHYEGRQSFSDSGIHVLEHDLHAHLDMHPYAQGGNEFLNGLSVVDALMNIGSEGIIDLLTDFHKSVH